MKKNKTKIFITFLILMIILFSIRLYLINKREVVDTTNFTYYFQEGEGSNGGLELVTENLTTFKKEYSFTETTKEEYFQKKVEIKKYTVVAGDNLSKISNQLNITIDTLKMNNKDVRNGRLRIGDVLSYPTYDGIYYKIKRNDNLSKIARLYGVKVSDITEYNNVNPRKLIAGKEIFVANISYKKYMEVENHGKVSKPFKTKTTKKTSKKSSEGTSSSSSYGFNFPVKYIGIASPFGNRFHPVLKRYILHTGVDFIAKYVPLRASKSGVVSYAGYMRGYGKIIIIKHSEGYETRYAHLSVISTKVGENVARGELIGRTGASGRVTGPHLHFEIRKNGKPQNPMRYL